MMSFHGMICDETSMKLRDEIDDSLVWYVVSEIVGEMVMTRIFFQRKNLWSPLAGGISACS